MSGMDNHANFVKIDTQKINWIVKFDFSDSIVILVAKDEKAANRESEMSKDEHLSKESNILKYLILKIRYKIFHKFVREVQY